MATGEIIPRRGLRLDEEQTVDSFGSEMEALHRDINRVFANALSDGSLLGETWTSRDVVPRLDLTEDDDAFHVTVELPGMDGKDVAVSVADRALTIRGEKKQQKERKDGEVHRSERAYGSFCRVIELPSDVDAERIDASFRKGVLTIALPKTVYAQANVKQIPVKVA